MNIHAVLEIPELGFTWYNVVGPSRDELMELAGRFALDATSIQDCLDPEHLPKFEQFEGYTFVIVRAFDERAEQRCATVQELTRKIAIFSGPAFLLTVHSTAQPWLSALEERVRGGDALKGLPARSRETLQVRLVTEILNGAVDTYTAPLEAVEARIDRFEEVVFSGGRAVGDLREIHLLKRQVTLVKRLLWRTVDVIQRMSPATGRAAALFQDVRENAESSHFYADELLDDVNTILHIQLALASHQTSEVMRVLTIFSVFFLPLTFIVGVYGMNFEFMPELHERWGYPLVLAAMGVVTLVIYLWFRRRGWLGR